VDSVVDRKGTRQLAQAYLEFLYTKEGQELAAKNYYRPRDSEVAARYAERYPPLKMFDIQMFGGWAEAQTKYFADGGLFDRIYTPGK
jgi:sulfate transport system substrate-binding protein